MKAKITGELGNKALVEVGGQSNCTSNAQMLEIAKNLLENGIDVQVIPGRVPSNIGDNLLGDLLELTGMSFTEQARALTTRSPFTISA